ncbi:hypothetical protein IAD21_00923 [Abditibacteriota bacterium]|nr:hypothetical protein IAD21_00923 [Abditibacteriota bacterium]
MTELTRAELRVWALEKMGIKVAYMGGRLWIIEPQTRFNEAPDDPTTDIAAAWELWAGIEEGVSHNVGFHALWTAKIWGQVEGVYREAVVHVQSRDMIPLAMSAAYYEWRTGQRVVLREE